VKNQIIRLNGKPSAARTNDELSAASCVFRILLATSCVIITQEQTCRQDTKRKGEKEINLERLMTRQVPVRNQQFGKTMRICQKNKSFAVKFR